MFEIHGHTEGIRQTELKRLQALYLSEFDADTFLTEDLALALADASARINRELAVYLSRGGEILDIVIGDTDTVDLPEYRLRRDERALSRVRVIHTHPSGTAQLSALDLTALASLRLDAICALGVSPLGQVTGVSAAFLHGWENGVPAVEQTDIVPLSRLSRCRWMQRIEEADAALRGLPAPAAEQPERALLVSIRDDRAFEELDALARTAGALPVGRVLQRRPKPDSASYVGAGKLREIALTAQTLNADLIIAEDELSGAQLHLIETQTGVRTIDRTALILDIFAQRARTREGQLQVSLAQLSYQASHLIGYGLSLSRLGGGIGTRGPGESKLEMDRRAIRRRRAQLTEQLEALKKQRDLQKKRRGRNEIPTAALVGYTNAGKSTLFNAMSGADVFVENQLFATLDATTRRISPNSGAAFLLSDTVGFISHLPTELIEAFQSTLEEAAEADLLLIVSDASNPDAAAQRAVVQETLERLGAGSAPCVEVLNKCDCALPENLAAFPDAVHISALNGEGVDALREEIGRRLDQRRAQVRFEIPYSAMQLLNLIHEAGQNVTTSYEQECASVTAALDQASLMRILKAGGGVLTYEVLTPEET